MYVISLLPNPHFLSLEDENRSYRAIARLALYWGPVELQIEGMLNILRTRMKDQGPFPASFSRKVEELKDHLRSEPELVALRAQLGPLLTRAKLLHRVRTHVVHSYFQGQYDDGRLGFGRSDQKIGVSYDENRYSPEELEIACADMIELHNTLAGFHIPFSGSHTMRFFIR